MRVFWAIAASLSLLAACAETEGTTVLPDRVIDETFGGGELVWTNLAKIPYRIGIFDQDGVFVVCAAVQNVRTNVDQRVMSAMVLEVNGEVLQRGFRFASRYASGIDLDGRDAACRLTQTPVMENAEFSLRLSQSRF